MLILSVGQKRSELICLHHGFGKLRSFCGFLIIQGQFLLALLLFPHAGHTEESVISTLNVFSNEESVLGQTQDCAP